MESLNENGKEVFIQLFKFAEEKSLPIHWGTKAFSMNIDKNGIHVAICYGYPPKAVFKQSVYTALVGRDEILSKLTSQKSNSLGMKHKKQAFFEQQGENSRL